jgi:predicted secreted protein
MSDPNYLQWLSGKTRTAWWHDSGDPKELQQALADGAVGVTTNSILSAQALKNNKEYWRDDIQKVLDAEKNPKARAESLMRIVVTHAPRG